MTTWCWNNHNEYDYGRKYECLLQPERNTFQKLAAKIFLWFQVCNNSQKTEGTILIETKHCKLTDVTRQSNVKSLTCHFNLKEANISWHGLSLYFSSTNNHSALLFVLTIVGENHNIESVFQVYQIYQVK